MDDDLLIPYLHGHGPSHSHRHVRSCQSLLHGNTTHESWPSNNRSIHPSAESSVFVTDVPGSSRWVYGGWTCWCSPSWFSAEVTQMFLCLQVTWRWSTTLWALCRCWSPVGRGAVEWTTEPPWRKRLQPPGVCLLRTPASSTQTTTGVWETWWATAGWCRTAAASRTPSLGSGGTEPWCLGMTLVRLPPKPILRRRVEPTFIADPQTQLKPNS